MSLPSEAIEGLETIVKGLADVAAQLRAIAEGLPARPGPDLTSMCAYCGHGGAMHGATDLVGVFGPRATEPNPCRMCSCQKWGQWRPDTPARVVMPDLALACTFPPCRHTISQHDPACTVAGCQCGEFSHDDWLGGLVEGHDFRRVGHGIAFTQDGLIEVFRRASAIRKLKGNQEVAPDAGR